MKMEARRVIRRLMFGLLLLPGWLPAQVDVQGHRGWRGMYPENTLTGFVAALELGVDVLEMDVVLSADGHPVVSHEPWMNPEICLGPEGKGLKRNKRINIYRLTLEEIRAYNCGTLRHPRFPDQRLEAEGKPSLAEVLQVCEAWSKAHPGISFGYNIEIKRKPSWENRYCPPVPEFCDEVLKVIRAEGLKERCVIQSFDPEVLEYLHRHAPEYPLAFLVEKREGG
jgi:glycerophosphoryl diester phosphodiesterase